MTLRKLLPPAAAALLSAATLYAIRTHSEVHAGFDAFIEGEAENVSLSSLGALEAAPAIETVAELDEPVIWNAIGDGADGLFVGTGNEGRVYHIVPGGEEPELIFAPQEVMARGLAYDGASGDLYVGTSPEGKVYRIREGERPEVFFDPEALYVWDLALDAGAGVLYVATGQPGHVYRLPLGLASGAEPEPIFSAGQTHVNLIEPAPDGALLAATTPGALLYRLGPDGSAEALFNAGSDEISAILPLEGGGAFFASFQEKAEGGKTLSPMQLPAILQKLYESGGELPDEFKQPSFVYHLDAEGFVEPVWTPGENAVFSLAYHGEDELLVGVREAGRLFAVKDRNLWKLLRQVPREGQVTQLLPTSGGGTWVITSNPAGVYRLGGEPAEQASYTGPVFDAGQVSRWGRLEAATQTPGTGRFLSWETRSGNTEEPGEAWSTWAEREETGRIASPPGRYLQYRMAFDDARADPRQVRAFYQMRNLAPVVNRVNIVPVGVEMVTVPKSGTTTIKPEELLVGGKDNGEESEEAKVRTQFRVMETEGYVTAGWQAFDPNGDPLLYDVALRGGNESAWVTLASRQEAPSRSINTRGLADGYYQVRVSAHDSRGNPPGESLSGENYSSPFLVDNAPPAVNLERKGTDGGAYEVVYAASDSFSILSEARYTLNGERAEIALPEDGLFDAREERFILRFEGLEAGSHSLVLEVEDESGNASVAKTRFTVE